ncbi:MAG: DinB family protein [Gemmatimonadales bacterium]
MRISWLVLVLPSLAAAQAPSRMALLDDWAHQERHILAVIDSATPGMLSFRTTPGVRTFAEQIEHITIVAATITSQAVAARALPPDLLGDRNVYLADRALLRAQAERVFDYVRATLSAVTDDEFGMDRQFAGGSMSRWRWNVTALQHSAWTLGQLVPYLRMNGRTPPQFTPF